MEDFSRVTASSPHHLIASSGHRLFLRRKVMSRKIALISEHASPLAVLGGVDSGGQNVYVGQLAKHLAADGYQVDVFTRRDSEQLPETMEWLPGVRVIHV